MDQHLTLGVVATSRKPDERRLPIHPAHLERIDPDLRARIFLEHGYGERFGVSDDAARAAGRRPALARGAPRASATSSLLPKPLPEDLADAARRARSLWGWPHCVQDREMTQLAIDRRLTLIAFEAMNHWTGDGALQPARLPQEQRAGRLLLGAARPAAASGSTGDYGRRLRAVVIGFGATARGAVTRAEARSASTTSTVLTHRGVAAVAVADPLGADRALRPRPGRPAPHARARPSAGRVPLADVPRRARHRRQLHAAGHRRAADVRRRTTTWRASGPGTPDRRRLLRRGHGLRVGPADDVRRADVHGRATTSTTTPSTTARRTCGTPPPGRSARRCCPYLRDRDGRARRRGTPTRRSAGPSRSATASSRTRASCPSRAARRPTRTRSALSLTRPPPTSSTRSAMRSRK